jgi:sugar lactone lactonase YvrE
MTGATATYLNLPIGIWVDTSNNLYVADASNNRIQRFALGNTTGTTVAGSSSGVGGSSASSLNYTNDMRVDSNGNIYVVDSYNNRVQLWNASASVGITIAGNGK